MGITLPGHLAQASALMGVQFPGTDEDQLRAMASDLGSVLQRAQGVHGDLDGAVSHVEGENEGQAVASFSNYMRGKSNVTGTQRLVEAGSQCVQGLQMVMAQVITVKMHHIAAATAVHAAMQTAKATPMPMRMLVERQVEMFAKQCGTQVRQMDQSAAGRIAG